MSNHDAVQLASNRSMDSLHDTSTFLGSQAIDTDAPLILYSSIYLSHFNLVFLLLTSKKCLDQRLLVLDLLSVHLVRNINGSTIISYHPTMNIPATTAKFLHERIRFAGTRWKLITILVYLSNPRPKCVLAKHVPNIT